MQENLSKDWLKLLNLRINEWIQDAKNFGCQGCPKGTIDEEMKRFNETNKRVKIARRCNCGRKPGTTVVEIMIKPEGKLEHFKLIEKIPFLKI